MKGKSKEASIYLFNKLWNPEKELKVILVSSGTSAPVGELWNPEKELKV